MLLTLTMDRLSKAQTHRSRSKMDSSLDRNVMTPSHVTVIITSLQLIEIEADLYAEVLIKG